MITLCKVQSIVTKLLIIIFYIYTNIASKTFIKKQSSVVHSMGDGYVCTLDAASLEKARVELGEDPLQREAQVKQLREWVESQPHLVCGTETYFMLLFLRRCKFSQLAARKMLEDFLTLCTEIPEWFRNIDPLNKGISSIYSKGHVIPLPGRDSEGRTIIIMRAGVFDVKDSTIGPNDIIKNSTVVFSILQKDEMAQVNGYVLIFDYTGFTAKHLSFLGIEMVKKSTKFWQDNFPARFKALHYYNTGPVFDTIMTITRPFLSKKIQDRMFTHGNNLESLYKHVPMHLLPEEYLPDDYTGPNAGTIQNILDDFAKRFTDPKQRAAIIKYTTEGMYIDEKKRPSVTAPAATFRKLNID
ncbi:unnamed protein product [Owenia fusiformis]|uniref:CRAL-TRIO domain-containing protein n=1 Tax=Owenia fusiformis TaxID=6347 RepID=A0A8S4NJR9_OWEFU|nr:unnamed protein product [Owenia fusiformis]